jgi:hypothetical protein
VETVAVTVLAAYDVTVLPPASFTLTLGCVVNAAPDAVPTAACVIVRVDAAPVVGVTD